MVSIHITTVQLSPSEHQRQLRRAVIASTVGTAIEWYDFFLYSTVTGLVFASCSSRTRILGSERSKPSPLCGGLCRAASRRCHLGPLRRPHRPQVDPDRNADAVALVPTYDSIGIWGAVILTILPFIQRVGVGGEWGGSVLM
jgi:hypothetical protein